jgi:hypothetical protein
MIVKAPIEYIYLECPSCEYTMVRPFRIEPYGCPLCAADCARDQIMLARPALAQDVPEGADCRFPALEAQRARRTG